MQLNNLKRHLLIVRIGPKWIDERGFSKPEALQTDFSENASLREENKHFNAERKSTFDCNQRTVRHLKTNVADSSLKFRKIQDYCCSINSDCWITLNRNVRQNRRCAKSRKRRRN
jgi:hypothetical protein